LAAAEFACKVSKYFKINVSLQKFKHKVEKRFITENQLIDSREDFNIFPHLVSKI